MGCHPGVWVNPGASSQGSAHPPVLCFNVHKVDPGFGKQPWKLPGSSLGVAPHCSGAPAEKASLFLGIHRCPSCSPGLTLALLYLYGLLWPSLSFWLALVLVPCLCRAQWHCPFYGEDTALSSCPLAPCPEEQLPPCPREPTVLRCGSREEEELWQDKGMLYPTAFPTLSPSPAQAAAGTLGRDIAAWRSPRGHASGYSLNVSSLLGCSCQPHWKESSAQISRGKTSHVLSQEGPGDKQERQRSQMPRSPCQAALPRHLQPGTALGLPALCQDTNSSDSSAQLHLGSGTDSRRLRETFTWLRYL